MLNNFSKKISTTVLIEIDAQLDYKSAIQISIVSIQQFFENSSTTYHKLIQRSAWK